MANDYSDPRWQKLRLRVMDRDAWMCVACGDTKATLHVHHKRYCGNIWDSPVEDLQTLCNGCHMGLGSHPKAGIWYELVSDIKSDFLVADNWNNKPDKLSKDAVSVAVQNCPQCGHREFSAGENLINCLACGWYLELLGPTFLHTPATLINPEKQRQKQEAEELAKKKAAAIGQLKTWARKCRSHGFSEQEIWSAVFPEHAVPLGYQFDADGLMSATDLADEEAQKLRAYLTSGMSFRDVVFEIASLSHAGRKALMHSGY
jgi:RNA polymerase subunit RPABC4/transcription elongation factor Spt4